jgi:hypothetical protein
MRSFRLVWALVLAASLAILPVSASFAMAHVATTEVGMTASRDDCPCCKPMKVDSCFLKCCQVQAVAVDGLVIAKLRTPRLVAFSAKRLMAVALRPDPPPPRS